MSYQIRRMSTSFADEFNRYAHLRRVYTCEGQFLNEYIWDDFYNGQWIIDDDPAHGFMFDLANIRGRQTAMLPFCREEDIAGVFWKITDYFAAHTAAPFRMEDVDGPVLAAVRDDPEFIRRFQYEESRKDFDYVYDAERLRTLSGKMMHKKKNHLNSFLRMYAGRFEYRTLTCADLDLVRAFHESWVDERKTDEHQFTIQCEENGVHRVFEHCSEITSRIGGVFIDGKLAAYSLGSYDETLKEAFINIEKADPQFEGLYAFINQQFLSNEFPLAELVNREDDLGLEGLRNSKLSYKPIRFEEKYIIKEKE